MEIRNVTQFANFVSAHGLAPLDSMFIQTLNCLNNYKSMCNCSKAADKLKRYVSCNKLYADSVRTVVPKFKNEFLSKIQEYQISFYSEDGCSIGVISR
jgi:hypothetical protein